MPESVDQIMSDEFETEARSFADGHDPMWTSTTHSDDAMTSNGLGSQMFYNSSYGSTNGGELKKGCRTVWGRYGVRYGGKKNMFDFLAFSTPPIRKLGRLRIFETCMATHRKERLAIGNCSYRNKALFS